MSNRVLQQLLGTNYIPEQLPDIPLNLVLAELAEKLLGTSRNFANVPFSSVADWLAASDENTQKLREILRPLTEDVDPVLKAEFLQYATEHSLKYTPEDIVFIHNGAVDTSTLYYIWLELGDRRSGLIHMIADRVLPKVGRGHYEDYLNKVLGLESFHDFFDVIKFLLRAPGHWIIKEEKPAYKVTIAVSTSVGAVILTPGNYILPIGSNGYMVSFYPEATA